LKVAVAGDVSYNGDDLTMGSPLGRPPASVELRPPDTLDEWLTRE
jgi:hypothetical protein